MLDAEEAAADLLWQQAVVGDGDCPAIRGTMEKCAILAWAHLPDDGFPHREKRTLTFTFADGRTITVPDDRLLPQQIRGGFFNIQHPLTSHT